MLKLNESMSRSIPEEFQPKPEHHLGRAQGWSQKEWDPIDIR